MPPISQTKKSSKTKQCDLTKRLLAWYDIHRRVLPWRDPKGKRADPYRIWLSEIMLQQTKVQAVGSYYRKFLALWPDVKALAGAKQDDVLAAWAGLGYYARARNLHATAKIVANEMSGKFPLTAQSLRALPGVGGYTAGAISAIAYDEKQAAMDANAERVIARLYAVETPMPKAKVELHALCSALVPERAGDFAQALMDLGSAICTSRRPACPNCPWMSDCKARKRGIQELLPVKAPKMVRPLRRGAAFVALDKSGAVLLVKRPEKGLLASMLEPPLGPWEENFPSSARALKQAPFDATWKKRPGIVRHGFTHFELEIEVYMAEVANRPKLICHSQPSACGKRSTRGEGNPGVKHRPGSKDLDSLPSVRETRASPGMTRWVNTDDLRKVALPTVMRKIVEHAIDTGGLLFSLRKP